MNNKAVGRRHCLEFLTVGVWLLVLGSHAWAQQLAPPKQRPNVVMIVADDLNWDTPGCFGGAAPQITPHIDKLSTEGIRFLHAYVNVSICTPSRSVLLTGLYPTSNGVEGFQRIRTGTETLPAALNKAGYLCGIIGKPLRQQELFRWSVTYQWQGVGDENLWGRDPVVYQEFAGKFFEMAKVSGQPFFLMANSHDPHRPFAGGQATRPHEECAPASRVFQPEEIRVPGFLPDLPEVRKELAEYCTSARRLDDMVGVVLGELAKANLVDNTIVIFLSDHGMDFPAAKFNCYMDSVRSPWIIRWPGQIKKGAIDRTHMISAVDLHPTILEAVGLTPKQNTDGRSFLPIVRGLPQSNRDCVFTQFHHIHGKDALPMRSVLTKETAYVFNPWSNGERRFTRLGGATFKAMRQAANTDARMAARVRHLQFRTVEEFYDLGDDPNCLVNLLGNGQRQAALTATRQEQIDLLRGKLRQWMIRFDDPALDAFDNRHQPEALEKFIQDYRAQSAKEVEALKPYEKANDYRF